MTDTWFGGRRVSGSWGIVLTQAAKLTSFHLNSGRRTMSEQWYFYTHQPPPAAYPNANAPHIRQGREAHALDVATGDGGVYRLAAILRRWGVYPRWTVRGEPWHIEITEAELARLTRRFRRTSPRTLRRGAHGATVRRLQRILRARGFHTVPAPGKPGYGYYGRTSRSAVRRIQRRHRLKVDGIVGPATWRLLLNRR
jgi:hypothetical protein